MDTEGRHMRLSVSVDGRCGRSVVTLRRTRDVMMPDDARAAMEIAAGLGASGWVEQAVWDQGAYDARVLTGYRAYRVTPKRVRLVDTGG